MNDAGHKLCDGLPSGRNSALTGQTAEPRILPEQCPSSAEDGTRVTDELHRSAAAVQESESMPYKKHLAPSSQGFQLPKKVDLNTEQLATTATSRKNSLNDLIEAMLNFQPVMHTQQTSDVPSLQDMEKAHNEDGASESARTPAGVEEELPKTVPDVYKEESNTLPPDSVRDKDVIVAVPDVSIDRSSLPRDFVTDSEVSMFMAGNDAVDLHRQPADRQTRPTAAQLKDSNNEQHPNKQDGGAESKPDLEQRVQENDGDRTLKVVAFCFDKRITNQTPREKRFPTKLDLDGKIHAAEISKSLTTEQRREEMPNLENTRESENETKPKTAESALPVTVAPFPQQRISVKILLSATSVIANSEETGRRSNERTAEPEENLKQVDADKSAIGDELKVLRAKCFSELGREEKMEVDEDAAQHASEARAAEDEIKSEKCCKEMLTRGKDEVDSVLHHRHQQQQQQQQLLLLLQQQQWLETESESIVMPTTLEEGRGTLSTADETTVTKDADISTLEDPAQSSDLNQETTANPDIGNLPDQITTANTSPDNHGLSDDVNEPTAEVKTTQEDCVKENVAQQASDPLGEDVIKFPKSSTGHKESAQKDRRTKRLTKTVRIYHDLSTVIDYCENDREAVTTIYLKSARKH